VARRAQHAGVAAENGGARRVSVLPGGTIMLRFTDVEGSTSGLAAQI